MGTIPCWSSSAIMVSVLPDTSGWGTSLPLGHAGPG